MTIYNNSGSGGPATYGPKNIPEAYAVTVKKSQSTAETKDFIVKAYCPQTWSFDQTANYEPIVGGSMTSGLIGNVMAAFGVSAVFQPLTAKVWRGTSDSPITLTLEFQAETDAYKDVILPTYYLASLCSPTVAKNGISGKLGLLQSPAAHLDTSVFKGSYEALKGLVSEVTSSVTNPSLPPIQNITTADPSSLQAICGPNFSLDGNSNQQTAAASTPAFGTLAWFKRYMRNIVQLRIGKTFKFDMIVPISFQQNIAMQPDSNGYPSYIQATFVFQPVFMITLDDLGDIFGILDQDRVNAQPPASPVSKTELPAVSGAVTSAVDLSTVQAVPLPDNIVPNTAANFKRN